MPTPGKSAPAVDLEALSDEELNRLERLVQAQGWEDGSLAPGLRAVQRPIYDDIKAQLWGDGGYVAPSGPQRRYLLKCHRRLGKSDVVGRIASELCRAKDNGRVYWAAETGKQAGKIVSQVMPVILRYVPEHMRPRWYKSDGMWVWPGTEAQMHLAGCEDEMKADRLRGDGADLFIIDEAGSIDCLKYVYRSIALWMVADRGGRIIMPSSPAKSPGHMFTAYCADAEGGRGGYSRRTIHDSNWSQELIDELAAECGGTDTVEWQREALAMDVVDEERAVVAEFTRYEAQNFRDVERPQYFYPIVVMDVGHSPSLTFVGLGYYDFEKDIVVIERELEIAKVLTDDLAAQGMQMEHELWGEHFAAMRDELPFRDDLHSVQVRASDVAPILLGDLEARYGWVWGTVRKDDNEAAIQAMRVRAKRGGYAISSQCPRLRAHLKAGIWNKARSGYEFMDGFGHFDGVDMLKYFTRAVDTETNPWPPEAHGKTGDWFQGRPEPEEEDFAGIKDLFK